MPATTAAISIRRAQVGRARPTSHANPAMSTKASSAACRGPSQAGSTVTGESPRVVGKAPSLRYASTPKAMAHTVVNPRNPRVAADRRRSRMTAA